MAQYEDRRAFHRNGVFVLHFGITFLLLSTFLFAIDFVPELVQTEASTYISATTTAIQNTTVQKPESPIPVRVVIDTIGVDTPIIAPEDTRLEVLDRALLLGAVLYPGSGSLGHNANLLLFGHSSYLPVVHNKAYKAFNELGKLTVGDEVVIESNTHRYTYAVTTVRMENAENVRVSFEADTPTITLATCNNFGEKEDRWVVTGTLLKKEEINTT